MFITPQSIKAETAYKQARTKREFRATTRRDHAKRAQRHARRAFRPTTAA